MATGGATDVVYVYIKLQNDYLNINPACSACLCVNERRRRAVSLKVTSHTEARVTLALLSDSTASRYDDDS